MFYCLALFVFPLLVALFHYLASGLVFKALIFEVGLGVCFGWVLLMKFLSQLKIKSNLGKLLIPLSFCTVFPIFVIGIPLFLILTIQNFGFGDFMKIVKLAACFLVLLITGIIVGFYFRYFYYKEEDLFEIEDENKEFYEKIGGFNWVPGIITFLLFLGVYIYCVVRLVSFIENLDFSAGFYLNLIYLVLIPLMIFLGIFISRLGLRFDLKLNIFTAIFGLIPTVIFLSLYLNFPDYQTIFRYFLVLPPFFTIFWSSLSTINIKIIYNWSLMFSCITIAFPIGFLLPFGLFGEFKIIAVYTIIGLFLLFPFIYFINSVYKSIKDFRSKDKIEKAKILKNTTFYKTTLFIITSIFILSEGTLLYMYFTAPYSSPATGAVLSMLIVLVILFVLSSITLQVDLNRPLVLKLSISIVIVLSVFCLIAGVLSAVLEDFGNDVSVACIASSISCIILAFLSVGLIQFKYSNPEFSKLLMVICNLTLWIFLVMPLAVGLPSALSRAKNTKSRNKIIGIATIFIGIVFMVGVSIVSILYNIYQKKIEKERKAIECCNFVCRQLKSQRIKCEYLTARDFFEIYSQNDFSKERLESYIIEKSKFELVDSKSKTKYSKIYKIANLQKNNEKKENTQKKTIWEQLNCFDKQDYEKNEEVNSDSDSDNEIDMERPLTIEDKPDNSILEVDLELMEELPYEEYIKIRPIGKYQNFEYDYKDFPKLDEEKIKLNQLSQLFSRDIMSMVSDMSKRKDWLGCIFDILANEPDEVINEKWMSEITFLLLLKHSGINENLISDKRMKMLYFFITMQDRLRPLNQKLFINEALPQLAEIIFPNIDKVKREKIIIVDYMSINLQKNFHTFISELQSQDSKNIESDPFRKNLLKTITKDVKCSQRDDLSIYMVKDTSKDSETALNEIQSSKPEFTLIRSGFYFWFIKKGEKLLKFFQRSSQKLESLLKNLYLKKQEPTIEKPEIIDDTQRELQTFEEVNNFIQKKIDETRAHQEVKLETLEKISFSFPNLITIFTKTLEVYQLSSIGLKKEVSWNIFREPLARSSDVMLIENNPYFIPVFWVTFSVAICYVPVAWYSKSKIILGGIGKDAQGEKQKITTAEGFRKLVIIIAGSQFYMFIIKSQLSVFACNLEEEPPVLWNTNIVCYETLHVAHFFCAIACIFVYYPIATFIYPMLQFNDSKLQIKFQTTFVIILSQTKLIITALTVFLPYQYYLKYQLVLASGALLFLFIYFTVEKPCLVTKVNIWMSAGYFMAFLTNFMGFINMQVEGSLAVNITFFVLLFITLVTTVILHVRHTLKNKAKTEPSTQQAN